MFEISLISALKIYLMLTSHLRVIDPLFGGSFERIFPIVVIVATKKNFIVEVLQQNLIHKMPMHV